MVCEGFHEAAEEVMEPQSVSVASKVSSKTQTSSFSSASPFFEVTTFEAKHYIEVLQGKMKSSLGVSC